jgi:alpha-galactosidase
VVTLSNASVVLDYLPSGYPQPSVLPWVVLTSPTNSSTFSIPTFSAPATINLLANVFPNGNTVNSVQFYNNAATLLGQSFASPYARTLTNVGSGILSVTACVTYNNTNTVVSAPVNVAVMGTQPAVAMAPAVYGSRPGTPFLLYLAAAGIDDNRTWTATGLPSGLSLNPTNGIITGTTPAGGSYNISWTVTGANAAVSNVLQLVSGTNLCLMPPVGWNSWNCFQANVTETNVEQIADAIVHAGLLDYGFSYVNLDDEWAQGSRMMIGNQLQLVAVTNRFPSGMAALGGYLHQRGLKFGIYSDAAATTCAGVQPGSYGYEAIDAGTFADWGVDYLKYDYCGAPSDQASAASRYTTMGNALATSGRSIIFSICEWGQLNPWLWAPQAGGHLWRTTLDMRDNWEFATNDLRNQAAIGVLDALDLASGLEDYQHPGAWNDPDMLMCGVDLTGSSSAFGATGLDSTQERAMFSIWALLSAPMIFNADLRQLDPQSPYYKAGWVANMMGILTNTEVWSVNQDPLGQQAVRVFRNGDIDVWRKGMADGSVVMGIINRGGNPQVASISPTNVVSGGGTLTLRDLWWHLDLGTLTNNTPVNLAPHETRLLRLRSVSAPVFNGGAVLQSGGIQLAFTGVSGQTFKVLASTNLLLPLMGWVVLTNGTFGNSQVTFTDWAATNSSGFYRLVSP